MRKLLLSVALAIALTALPTEALATTPRAWTFDSINSSATPGSGWTLPAFGGLMGSASMVEETPSGTVNGSNTSFTLSFTPATAATLTCHLDGLLITLTTDYTRSGATLTMVTAPATGQILVCQYSKN